MKRIAVLTSGGDSSGMNPCIRSVVRTGIFNGVEVFGAKRGYAGLINNDFISMPSNSVSGIINRGGTILNTSRCDEFLEYDGRKKAYDNLQKNKIDGLIVIGGDGSYRGALKLCREFNYPIIAIPGTIDNDISGTDYTVGYDTAINVATEAIDKIRDTASSHERLFLVEVMGKNVGYIALATGIASGAEAIIIPETKTVISKIVSDLEKGRARGKRSSIIVVAEGDEAGGAFKLAKLLKDKIAYDVRVSVLGHIQRGGSPTAYERIMAARFGYHATLALLNGETAKAVGWRNEKINLTPLKDAIKYCKKIKKDDLSMAKALSI